MQAPPPLSITTGHDAIVARIGVKQLRSALPTTTSRIPVCVIRTRIPLVTPRVLVGLECRWGALKSGGRARYRS